jgi:hypothetical protein
VSPGEGTSNKEPKPTDQPDVEKEEDENLLKPDGEGQGKVELPGMISQLLCRTDHHEDSQFYGLFTWLVANMAIHAHLRKNVHRTNQGLAKQLLPIPSKRLKARTAHHHLRGTRKTGKMLLHLQMPSKRMASLFKTSQFTRLDWEPCSIHLLCKIPYVTLNKISRNNVFKRRDYSNTSPTCYRGT